MASGSRHGKPEDEMFLTRPQAADSPTIEPLRIFKHDSRSPESDHRSGLAQKTAFPLPPGASSSPAPLPYPDDRPRTQRPSNGRKTVDEHGRASPSQTAASLRADSGSSDPSRAGIPEYPPSLRPSNGRDGQANARLAERRGNTPKPLPEAQGSEAPDQRGLISKNPSQRWSSSGARRSQTTGSGQSVS